MSTHIDQIHSVLGRLGEGHGLPVFALRVLAVDVIPSHQSGVLDDVRVDLEDSALVLLVEI